MKSCVLVTYKFTLLFIQFLCFELRQPHSIVFVISMPLLACKETIARKLVSSRSINSKTGMNQHTLGACIGLQPTHSHRQEACAPQWGHHRLIMLYNIAMAMAVRAGVTRLLLLIQLCGRTNTASYYLFLF